MILPEWLSGLHFAFSRKADGQMSFKRAEVEVVIYNRVRFLERNGLSIKSVIAGELPHSANIAVVSRADRGRGSVTRNWIPDVDGLVTADRHLLLLTTHADCAPIIIYDPLHKVLGQAHAGWRGLAAGIVGNLVRQAQMLKGSPTRELRAWIGPTIGVEHYYVGQEVAELFPAECCVGSDKGMRLDLAKLIRADLEAMGVLREHISAAAICTYSHPEFSSYRRDGEEFHAMACVSGLR